MALTCQPPSMLFFRRPPPLRSGLSGPMGNSYTPLRFRIGVIQNDTHAVCRQGFQLCQRIVCGESKAGIERGIRSSPIGTVEFLRVCQVVINRESGLDLSRGKTGDRGECVVLVGIRSSRIIGARNQGEELLRDGTETTWIDYVARKLLSRNIAVCPGIARGRNHGGVGPSLRHVDWNLLRHDLTVWEGVEEEVIAEIAISHRIGRHGSELSCTDVQAIPLQICVEKCPVSSVVDRRNEDRATERESEIMLAVCRRDLVPIGIEDRVSARSVQRTIAHELKRGAMKFVSSRSKLKGRDALPEAVLRGKNRRGDTNLIYHLKRRIDDLLKPGGLVLDQWQ